MCKTKTLSDGIWHLATSCGRSSAVIEIVNRVFRKHTNERTMTLCKFFLQGILYYILCLTQGNCKNGSFCRFEHRAPKPHEPEYNEWRTRTILPS
jgi:hypothetical protein